jgi:hypothetical protein
MKKKIITMLLATALTVSMITGCGGSSEPAATEPAVEEEVEEEATEEEATEEEATEEETSDSSASSGDFTLLDVDESMVDVGAYGKDDSGLELVFTMFTGPDSNKYVSLFGFDNSNNNGYVICGQYEAETETDEDGDEWTYFDVSDVYSGEHFNLGVCERPSTEEIAFFDKEGNVVEGKFLSSEETINYMGSAVALLSE